MAQHGTAWHSMAQHGTAWHSMFTLTSNDINDLRTRCSPLAGTSTNQATVPGPHCEFRRSHTISDHTSTISAHPEHTRENTCHRRSGQEALEASIEEHALQDKRGSKPTRPLHSQRNLLGSFRGCGLLAQLPCCSCHSPGCSPTALCDEGLIRHLKPVRNRETCFINVQGNERGTRPTRVPRTCQAPLHIKPRSNVLHLLSENVTAA